MSTPLIALLLYNYYIRMATEYLLDNNIECTPVEVTDETCPTNPYDFSVYNHIQFRHKEDEFRAKLQFTHRDIMHKVTGE